MAQASEAQYVRAFNAAANIVAASGDLDDADVDDVAAAVKELTEALADVQAEIFPKEKDRPKSSGKKSSSGSRKSSGRKGSGGQKKSKAITDGQLGFLDTLKDQIDEAGGDGTEELEERLDKDVEDLSSWEASKIIEELIEVRNELQEEE